MLFHSLTFFVFFFFFLTGLPLFRGRSRLIYTTAASYLFYAWWYPPYALILFGLTCFAYGAARIPRPSKFFFGVMVTLAFLPLCFFKYTGFLVQNLNRFFGTPLFLEPSWQLPLGISFITFTVLAYLVDVRRGKLAPETSFTRFALYLSFFPQLVAGPIMRPRELLPQLNHLFFKRKMLKLGLLLFAIGMLKKTVFADQIALFVSAFYDPASVSDLPRSLFAFYGFAVQIYCDFSGYTDMALGLAFVLGIRLPLNFNRPYAAVSIRDFWHRWHITLSRWLRDYLYIPLGGNRCGYVRVIANLALTMILGGLWHGAAWTFVFWGALHAVFLITEYAYIQFSPVKLNLPDWVRRIWTFHMVGFAWILFRAAGPDEVLHILSGFLIPGDWGSVLSLAFFPVCLIAACFLLHFWDRVSYVCWLVKRLPGPVLYAIAIILILTSKVISIGNPNDFIYFDF